MGDRRVKAGVQGEMKTRGADRHSPSLLGLPSTFITSALVGFCPSARITSPHWL